MGKKDAIVIGSVQGVQPQIDALCEGSPLSPAKVAESLREIGKKAAEAAISAELTRLRAQFGKAEA